MQDCELIVIHAAELVTCRSAGKPKRGATLRVVGIISDGAVAVADGRIVGIGTTAEILPNFEADTVINADGRVVVPGFVDPHTHIVYAGDRLNEFELKIQGAEYLQILANGGGIISTVRQTRQATIEQLIQESRRRLDKMLACGTTTCEIKTGYGLDTETEMKMLAAIEALDRSHAIDIVPTFLAAHAVPPEFKGNADAYVDLICTEMLPLAWQWYERLHFAAKGTRFFCDVFTEQNAYDLGQSGRVLEMAKALGFGIKAHVDQFTNLGGTHLAIDLEAISVDHLDAISDEEISQLSASETIGIVIPTENFNSGKMKYADARKMIDADCAIALSTDYNPGSAPCPSQPMAMAIACRYQKLLPAEVLNAATINAAYSIGMGDRVGSIELGKRADLALFDCSDHRQIANEFGGNLVRTVIKGGKVVYDTRSA
ncbi:MAG TPA: imidazolonepropionase [Pyrinomonadaceae bacterium]|nr:imidazolonepropionase [Pyrinomonadaceae bacterium]